MRTWPLHQSHARQKVEVSSIDEVIAIAAELWSPVRVYDTQQARVNAVTSNQRVSSTLGRRDCSVKIKKNCKVLEHVVVQCVTWNTFLFKVLIVGRLLCDVDSDGPLIC